MQRVNKQVRELEKSAAGPALRMAGVGTNAAKSGPSGTHLLLADQATRDIHPAIGADHARHSDTILILARRGMTKLERGPLSEGRESCLRLSGPLRGAEDLGFRRDRQRRREPRRAKTSYRDPRHGVFERLVSDSFARLCHGFFRSFPPVS